MPEPDDRTNWQRMLDGDHYLAVDPQMDEAAQRRRDFEAAYNDPQAGRDELRRLLGEWLGTAGPDIEIRPPLQCDYGFNLHIGARTYANLGLVALDVAPITIGEDCQIGPNVQLLTPTHPVDPGPRRAKWESAEPIVIGDNVWIGGGAIVLAGVTIGDDSVIGAGAVVTRDIPAGVVAVGNPARVVRRVGDDRGGS
jgi:maltose O-acetyltransferase